jgi:hypothetical protein
VCYQPAGKGQTVPFIKPKKTYIVRMRRIEIAGWEIEACSKDEAIDIALDTPAGAGRKWIESTSYTAHIKPAPEGRVRE